VTLDHDVDRFFCEHLNEPFLHVFHTRCHRADAPDALCMQSIDYAQHRSGGWNSGFLEDCRAERPISLELRPRGRGAAPANSVHPSVREELGRFDDIAYLELLEARFQQADLRHAKPCEVQ
jgi:hypothetical protein